MIKITNLHFSYDSKQILKDVSVSAKSGELLGILGANGCGKSTLLKNILGFLKGSRGEILINNQNISSLSSRDLARLIGYIPQKSMLTMPLKVVDFIISSRYSRLKTSLKGTLFGYQSYDFDIVERVARRLNVWQYKDRIVGTLSGGEFARVLLARAMCQEPRILLLDEPTSAMDLHYALEILGLVKEQILEEGLCGVIVVHDLMLAALFCDKIAFMKDGRIMDYGTPAELITAEKLGEVYENLECEVITHNGVPVVVPKVGADFMADSTPPVREGVAI